MLPELPNPSTSNRTLPSYAHPPLVQVRLAIRVTAALPLELGLLTEQLGPAWIKKPKPALPARFDADDTIATSDAWIFESVLGDQRLEAHPWGIDFHWDGRKGETYPHYESVRDTFLTVYDAWAHSVGADAPAPSRWQISYSNRFPCGTVWHRLDDLSFCRLLSSAGETPLAHRLQHFRQVWNYRLDDHPPAELQCETWLERGGVPAADDAIWLSLTCTGHCGADVDAEWLSLIDHSRRTIVATFRELMSAEANAYWGLLREPTMTREKKPGQKLGRASDDD